MVVVWPARCDGGGFAVATIGATIIKFEWDETKNRGNLRKHGFDLADAEEMFRGLLIVDPDTREDYGEKRWIGIGTIRGRTAVSRSLRAGQRPFALFL
jgi:uncharacterized DUF497 family protein